MSYLDVYEQAMQLPEEDRELLVLKLTAPATPVEHAEEWSSEVNRRIEEVDRGEVELMDPETVFARIREKHGIELS